MNGAYTQRWIGMCLVAAGLGTFLINAFLTPLLPRDGGTSLTAASTVFLWRQGASAATAALLLIASAGLAFAPRDGTPGWAALASVLALLGSAALLAQEWSEVFVVHVLAVSDPAALVRMDSSTELGLDDIGALTAFSAFAIGWLAVAASLLRTRGEPRLGPWLIVAGLFATPLLAAIVGPLTAAALGNGVLGAGWAMLGIARFRSRSPH
jgi:hypothetical protein